MADVFAKAKGQRVTLVNTQSKQIKKMYSSIIDDIQENIKFLEHRQNISSVMRVQYLKDLQKQISEALEDVDGRLEKTIKLNMNSVAQEVVKCNQALLNNMGFSDQLVGSALSYIPKDVVNEIITGKLYEGKWSLSKAIWNDTARMNKDLERIVATGVASQKSTYEIAKDLEKYVNPSAKKDWDWSKVYPGTKKKIDYNAQRLARTMVSHAYEESFVRSTKNNPFIDCYRWLISNSDRVCPICIGRAENDEYGLGAGLYPKDQLPLDHPNGMCTFEATMSKSYNQVADELADWVLGKGNSKLNGQIDDFVEDLGYGVKVKQFTDLQQKYLSPYGFTPDNMPKDFDEWSHKLDFDMGNEILHNMGTSWGDPHPYQQLMKYYQENLAQLQSSAIKKQVVSKVKTGVVTDNASFVAKYGTSKGKTFNYWYTKLDDEAKAIAKQLKESSGLTWQQWYEKNIFAGKVEAKPKAPKVPKAEQELGKYSEWLSKIKNQTEKEMLELEKRAFAKMSDDEVKGIELYTGSSYTQINGYLRHIARGEDHASAIEKSHIRDWQLKAKDDIVGGMKKASLEKDLVLRRGTDLGDLAGFMEGDFYNNKSNLEMMSIEELNQRFSGTVGVYAGLTSTSSLYDRGFTGNVEVIYNAPKGTQASSIMTVSQFGTGEGETLLNAGTKVLIRSIEKSDGHKGSSIRVFVDIIGNA
nr:MAG TPA: minor capsid protein [Bacteriophage sp.]